MHNPNFIPYKLESKLLADLSQDEFPTKLYAWNQDELKLPSEGTHFGYVVSSKALLMIEGSGFWLPSGSFFSVPTSCELVHGSGIVVTRLNYRGILNLGFSENTGRLKYIDGCSDSILIHPIKKGDACLNALFFPPGINQTQHTHPSMRVGVVASGEGVCITPDEEIPLIAGKAFIIPANALHSFRTHTNSMKVIAYHPDSDFGAEDENHPMINRTIVNGISASYLDEIRTKELANA